MDRNTIWIGIALMASAAVAFLDTAQYLPARAAFEQPFEESQFAVELVIHKPVPLTYDAIREDWEWFTEAEYFGAFAYNASEGTYNLYKGVPSIEQARATALRLCAAESVTPADCEIYAELHPKGENTVLPNRVSRTAEVAFFTEYLLDAQRWRHGAFAINGHGDWGWSQNYPSAVIARRIALEECESIAVETRAETDGLIVDSMIQPDGWRCKIIHETSRL